MTSDPVYDRQRVDRTPSCGSITSMTAEKSVDPADVKLRLERLSSLLDSVDHVYLGQKEAQSISPEPVSIRTKQLWRKQNTLTEFNKHITPRATSISQPLSPPASATMVSVIGGTPVTYDIARSLRQVVTGSCISKLSSDWMRTGFIFQQIDGPFPYGLLAERNGSRSLIICVQAFIMKHLIFKYATKEDILKSNVLQPTSHDRREALISALCEMIWVAGEQSNCVVCLPQDGSHLNVTAEYTPDGLTEKLCLFDFTDRDDLRLFIKRYLSYFEYGTTSGCLLFLYSVVLSRTFNRLYDDQGSTCVELLSTMEECTRGLLMLLLTGRAICYLHNGITVYDDEGEALSEPLKGLSARSECGHLYWHKDETDKRRTEIGSMLRTPRVPIWVTLLNGHHYGVLFGINPELVGNWQAENRFDLHYYTGLSNQTTPVRLSIDTRFERTVKGKTSALRHKEEKKIPTLERCILSKYPGADVNWNGVHPFI